MSDLELRRGVRALKSGGLAELGEDEVLDLYQSCARELETRAVRRLDDDVVANAANRDTVGARSRLIKARDYINSKGIPRTIAEMTPLELMTVNGLGQQTLLAAARAIVELLEPHGVPPIPWHRPPHYGSWLIENWPWPRKPKPDPKPKVVQLPVPKSWDPHDEG